MGKVIEKVIVKLFAQYYKSHSKLNLGQIETQNKRSAINVIVILIYIVQEIWAKKKLQRVLFIDVKGQFDHISRS